MTTPAIVTLEQAKTQLRISEADTSQDDQLADFVAGITAAVEGYKGEVVAQRTITERLSLTGRSRFRLWRLPVLELTSLTSIVDGTVWDISAFDVDPDSGLVEVLTGPFPKGRAIAVYDAGYAPVPQNYVQGALVILQHVWETQRGAGTALGGVIGKEEDDAYRSNTFSIPFKALEWLGKPRPVIA